MAGAPRPSSSRALARAAPDAGIVVGRNLSSTAVLEAASWLQVPDLTRALPETDAQLAPRQWSGFGRWRTAPNHASTSVGSGIPVPSTARSSPATLMPACPRRAAPPPVDPEPPLCHGEAFGFELDLGASTAPHLDWI
ncbi:unnamed protein product [Urochloa humidicola]